MTLTDTGVEEPQNRHHLVDAGKATRFQPGVSGNPGGRPKKDKAIRTLEDAVDDAATVIAKAVQQAVIDPADAQGFKAALEVLDRVLGKANQSVKIDAKLDHTSESVSDTVGWIEGTLRTRTDREATKLLPD